jgi:ubiquinone/menaquinone biosynthesis C-methylase UbiE
MDTQVKKNLIESYQTDGGFIVHDLAMLEKIYAFLKIDPKKSLDWRIYDLEGITHFFQRGVLSMFDKLHITKDDQVLSPGEGSGAPSRLLVKKTGCRVVGVDINPEQIKKAREFAVFHGVQDRTQYNEQDVEYLSLEKKDFTKAYCNETCGHWPNKYASFKNLHAHLVKGAMVGFNEWTRGQKASLNEAYDEIPEFRPLYKPGIWFQEDLETYKRLLEQTGFKIIEMYDCTDKVDIAMRARLKASLQWERYQQVVGLEARESALNYYSGMLKTHYTFLKYGVIIAQKY